jgi:hypothetical protein
MIVTIDQLEGERDSRFLVRAIDPREGVADMDGARATIYVRRGSLSSGQIAASMTIEPPVIPPEDL